jgi:glycosyl transferase family 87
MPEPASAQTALKPARPVWQIALALLILTIAPLWHLHVINRAMPPCKADLDSIWIGAQNALHGHNPYSNATTIDIQRFYYGRPLTPADHVNPMAYAYPMHTILLFAPIAPLPWSIVRPLFLTLLPLLTALSIPLWIRVAGINFTRRQTFIATVLCVLCWANMWAVHQIQPTLIVAFLAAAGCRLLQRGHAVTAGFVFALATIKPQLVGLLLLCLFAWAALRGMWSFFLSFGLTLGVLLAISFRMLPGWVGSWRQASAEYAVYRHLQLDLQAAFGHTFGLVFAAALAVCTLPLLWRRLRCEPDSLDFGILCSLALALTICILPSETAMVYNYVLAFPACLILAASSPAPRSYAELARKMALGLVGCSYFTVLLSAAAESLSHPTTLWDGLPFETALLPTVALIGLATPLLETRVSPAPLAQPA